MRLQIVEPKCFFCLAAGLILLSSNSAMVQAQLPGFEIVPITDDPEYFEGGSGSINNCGQVAYSQRRGQSWADAEIFVYDNTSTIRITDNSDRDVLPDISDNGVIVWGHGPGDGGAREIIMFQGGERFTISAPQSVAIGPSINNQGHVAWHQRREFECNAYFSDVYLYDGDGANRVSVSERIANQSVHINDYDQIAWTAYDFCPDPRNWSSDIMLYSSGDVFQLTDGEVEPAIPFINNLSQIGWVSDNPNNERMSRLWIDGFVETIADPGGIPMSNNLGVAALVRSPGEEVGNVWLYWIESEELLQITHNPYVTSPRDINDWGEIVISVFPFPERDLRLMRRIRTGDSEFDGDIDHDDLAKLVDCMTGPMWVERTNPGPEDSLCECRFLDINHDGSVGLRDYAIFQQNFGQ